MFSLVCLSFFFFLFLFICERANLSIVGLIVVGIIQAHIWHFGVQSKTFVFHSNLVIGAMMKAKSWIK
jgi:hypothetical protein